MERLRRFWATSVHTKPEYFSQRQKSAIQHSVGMALVIILSNLVGKEVLDNIYIALAVSSFESSPAHLSRITFVAPLRDKLERVCQGSNG